MNPWDGHKHTTGTKRSRMAEFQLRTIRVLDDLKHRQTTSKSCKFARSCIPISVNSEGSGRGVTFHWTRVITF
jgi:hypothetical protein